MDCRGHGCDYRDFHMEKNDEIDQTMKGDQIKERYALKTMEPGVYLRPDGDSLWRLIRAYNNFDKEIGYHQPYIFIASALLHYCESEEMAFFCMCYFMVTLNWRDHFLKPYLRS